MWVFCGHQTLTSEHKLCGWSIKLVRYSNNHDNSDVWVVYEHRNKFVSDLDFSKLNPDKDILLLGYMNARFGASSMNLVNDLQMANLQ